MASAALATRYDAPDMIATIKETVAKGANDAQLAMFLEVCRSTGLNPFLKEIWYVAEKGIIMAARDGYLRVANESPFMNGMNTHVERDEKGVPIKGVCTVWRKDREHPVTCEAYFSEYVKGSPTWKQYPSAMIAKVAEVLALKRSFTINGCVTEEEIGFDGSGSKAAAQEVAKAKIIEMQARVQPQQQAQAAARIADTIPEEWEGNEFESDLERELRESIEMAQRREARSMVRIKMMASFAELKVRYGAIRMEPTFFAVLGLHGVTTPEAFGSDEDSLAEARACYREMVSDLMRRESRAREARR